MSSLPNPVRYKLPLQYLSVQDWNNFVNDLLFILENGPGKWLEYFDGENMTNVNVANAKTGNFGNLFVNGHEALWNLKAVEAYTFGNVFQNWLNDMNEVVSEMNEIISRLRSMSIPVYLAKTIPETWTIALNEFEEAMMKLSYLMSSMRYKVYTSSYEFFPPSNEIIGLQSIVNGSVSLSSLIPPNLPYIMKYALIRNLGTSPIQVNGGIYLMSGDTLILKNENSTAKNLSEAVLTSSQPVPVGMIIGAIHQYPIWTITIQNSESDPTPSPFQILVQLDLSGVIQSTSVTDFLSLLFCEDSLCSKPLYAWIESYSSDLSSVNIWVLLPDSIPASSSFTFYMMVNRKSNYPYTGVAPQLSPIYAEYDNGENVFTFYDNFAGASLNTNKWTSYESSVTITVNNGVTMQFPSTAQFGAIITNIGFPVKTVFDTYLAYFSAQAGNENSEVGIVIQGANSVTRYGYQYLSWNLENPNGGTIAYSEIGNYPVGFQAGPNFPNNGNAVVSGYWVAKGDEGFGVNYQFVTSTDSTLNISSKNYFGMAGDLQTCPATATWQWARVRAFPPNGVMPSLVSFTKAL